MADRLTGCGWTTKTDDGGRYSLALGYYDGRRKCSSCTGYYLGSTTPARSSRWRASLVQKMFLGSSQIPRADARPFVAQQLLDDLVHITQRRAEVDWAIVVSSAAASLSKRRRRRRVALEAVVGDGERDCGR